MTRHRLTPTRLIIIMLLAQAIVFACLLGYAIGSGYAQMSEGCELVDGELVCFVVYLFPNECHASGEVNFCGVGTTNDCAAPGADCPFPRVFVPIAQIDHVDWWGWPPRPTPAPVLP